MILRLLAATAAAIDLAIGASFGLEAFLFVIQIELLALLFPVAWILTRAALHKPFELALGLITRVIKAIDDMKKGTLTPDEAAARIQTPAERFGEDRAAIDKQVDEKFEP